MDDPHCYDYQMANEIKPNAERKWPDVPQGTFEAWGHNTNNVFIIPEWNMAEVLLGPGQSDKVITNAIKSQFTEEKGRAIN